MGPNQRGAGVTNSVIGMKPPERLSPSEERHRVTVQQIRAWMRENKVTDAGDLPYTAKLDHSDEYVLVGRKVARVRKSYRDGKVPRQIAALYEALPGWSWTAKRRRRTYTQSRTAGLPDRALEWMRENNITDASLIPYTATLEHDGHTDRVGRSLDWIRRRYNNGKLSPDDAALFEKLPGWSWTPPRQRPPGHRRSSVTTGP